MALRHLLLPIFFSTLLPLFSSSTAARGVNPDYNVIIQGNVTPRFRHNVQQLLAALVSTSSTSMYHNATIGSGTSDAAYAQYTCWGNTWSPDCHSCVQDAADLMYAEQRNHSLIQYSYVWFDVCSVRFSDENFFGNLSASYSSGTGFVRTNSTGAEDAAMLGFLSKLAGDAARRPSPIFAYGENMTMHGLVQCTGDLSYGLCKRCLMIGVEKIGEFCKGTGKDKTEFYTESCSIRFNRTTLNSTTSPSGFAPSPQGNASLPRVNAPRLPWSDAASLPPVPVAWGAWVGVVSVFMLL